MTAIEKWFKTGCDYQKGVQLYANTKGVNKVLLLNFQKKQTPQLHERLKHELQKHVQLAVLVKPVPVVVNIPKPAQSKVDLVLQEVKKEEKKTQLLFHQLPAELRPVYLEATQLFREMCLLKVELNELPELAVQKALEIQKSIVKKLDANQLLWSKIDYWLKHKLIPTEISSNEFATLTPAELVKKEQYLFVQISKLNKRLLENRKKLETTNDLREHTKLIRWIAKQEDMLINKTEKLSKVKQLIHE